jgi:hypothetical protein
VGALHDAGREANRRARRHQGDRVLRELRLGTSKLAGLFRDGLAVFAQLRPESRHPGLQGLAPGV